VAGSNIRALFVIEITNSGDAMHGTVEPPLAF